MKTHIFVAFALLLGFTLSASRKLHGESSSDEGSVADEDVALFHNIGPVPKGAVFSSDSNKPESEHQRTVWLIREALTAYQNDYRTCIMEIVPEEYSPEAVEVCLGKNFIKLILDVKYETLKMMSKAETQLHEYLVGGCYTLAGANVVFGQSCDYLERDIIEFMWNGLDFVSIVEINKNKYLAEHATMPHIVYANIKGYLEKFSLEFFEVLDMIDEFKENIILSLKIRIDNKAKEHVEYLEASHGGKSGAVIHLLHIEEKIIQPNVPQDDLPNDIEREKREPKEGEDAEWQDKVDKRIIVENTSFGFLDDRRLRKDKINESDAKKASDDSRKQGAARQAQVHRRKPETIIQNDPTLNRLLHGLKSFADSNSLRSKNVHTHYVDTDKILKKYAE